MFKAVLSADEARNVIEYPATVDRLGDVPLSVDPHMDYMFFEVCVPLTILRDIYAAVRVQSFWPSMENDMKGAIQNRRDGKNELYVTRLNFMSDRCRLANIFIPVPKSVGEGLEVGELVREIIPLLEEAITIAIRRKQAHCDE